MAFDFWQGQEIFPEHPEKLWGQPSFPFNGCRRYNVARLWISPLTSGAKV
jgi:hypothetical protein